jgi:hypothetical protein
MSRKVENFDLWIRMSFEYLDTDRKGFVTDRELINFVES